ncbi:leucyl aminopeptidase [Alteriqipengyuania sp. NZ-12B]|uniref:Probable cytosol aminopeptidase n=1 Tax=Alteriqipengyuania abyssalis TaxID=2860200 RepID=A0ABS7PE19_9SPHN|nr:leucyl aminopeptidase [Alteriqipengyuania abyssalis]MBY8337236.1 leucyl aminopeptidase [Alteriqipengyuania abyssalis]
MQITFADSLPSDAVLIASIANKDSLPDGIEPALAEGAKRSRFKGSAGQVVDGFVERDGKVLRVALAGAGDPKAKDRRANLEKAGGALAAKFLTSGESTIALDLTGAGLSAEDAAAVLLGLRLRAWRWDEYRTTQKDAEKVSLKSAVIVGAPDGIETAWQREGALAEGVEFTKELVTLPANVLYPESFVERCRKALEGTGIEIIVLDDAQMEKLGMGALLGVGQGSDRPSRILAMRWNGGDEGAKPTLLVGKGVTFDSGGISIKPGAGMEDMKWDMGGAGAVAGTMVALAKRKAKANVVGVCGLVENMPDGKAQRPGDVVTTMSGQTVEVINTDAEGRLVLCDALHWAQNEFDPAAVIDLATLTGAMLIALGNEQAGLFSNDDTLAGNLSTAGATSGDKVWRMPIGPAYDKLIDSPIADMKNVGPREAGSITAAQFLQRFIKDGMPWAHLDIAGMAWSNKPGATYGKGATGYGVRLLDQYVRDVIEG